ncbi:hypothetical protein Plhal304r1_c043g0123871 [Plasmopara halstedii]
MRFLLHERNRPNIACNACCIHRFSYHGDSTTLVSVALHQTTHHEISGFLLVRATGKITA